MRAGGTEGVLTELEVLQVSRVAINFIDLINDNCNSTIYNYLINQYY